MAWLPHVSQNRNQIDQAPNQHEDKESVQFRFLTNQKIYRQCDQDQCLRHYWHQCDREQQNKKEIFRFASLSAT